MLQRMDDYYNWEKIEHWKTALDANAVKWQEKTDEHTDEKTLAKAIMLLKHNCYPISIICQYINSDNKLLLATPLWNDIFAFINNKRYITINGTKSFFENLPCEDRIAILNARVHSIWLKEI